MKTFFIRPENDADLMEAMELLSNYHVAAESYMDDKGKLYLAIIHDHYEPKGDDVRLAETAFQMSWLQGGKCPECTEEHCGHMVFTAPFNASF
jgi:hypothetical protein